MAVLLIYHLQWIDSFSVFAIWAVILVLSFFFFLSLASFCLIIVVDGLLLHLITLDDTLTHSHSQSLGTLSTSNWPITETSTWQHTTFTTDRIHAPGGIETRNSSKQAAANWSLSLHGHWDCLHLSILWVFNIENRMVYLCVEKNGSTKFSQGLDHSYLHFGFSDKFDFL